MKNLRTRIISLLLVLAMLVPLVLTACSSGDDPNKDPNDGGWQIPDGEYTIPKEDGHNQITFTGHIPVL